MLFDTWENIVKNSYKNFHTRGFSYICLNRSPYLTQKIYIFEGDVSQLSEVVNPHDHRYDFETHVLSGKVENRFYKETRWESDEDTTHFMREWRTPLNGGKGFSKDVTRCSLRVSQAQVFGSGENYFCNSNDLHTIQIHSDNTILLLNQFQDKIPLDRPTHTFFQSDELPEMTGLYEKFTIDEVRDTLRRLGL